MVKVKVDIRENIDEGGVALDWVSSMCRRWEKNDPMEILEGDSDDLILAKKALRAEMEEMGWDIYGGSTDPIVRAMNWAWQEGFIQGFLDKKI